MTVQSEDRKGVQPLVWERSEPLERPVPSPLNRARIVGAALAIADDEGLSSVSLRKVAAALDAGPMRLYGFMSTKEELFDLMVDQVYGEMALDEAPAGDWRATLQSVAKNIRQACRRHEWFIDLLVGRAQLGPNALAFQERSFSGLNCAPGFDDIDFAMQALRTITAYVIGAILREATELRAERESGMDRSQWQTAAWPYMQRVIATGRFPMLAKVVDAANHPPSEHVFEQGLEWVMDGIGIQCP